MNQSAQVMRRHPILTLFVIAMLVRCAVAVLFTDFFSGRGILDDDTYIRLARDVASDRTDTWTPYLERHYEATRAFVFPLSLVYEFAGNNDLPAKLFVALLGAGTAAAVAKLALEFGTTKLAMIAGGIVALLPSQVLWSSLVLKDAAVWATVTVTALIVVRSARASGWELGLMLGILTSLLLVLGSLRSQSLVVACIALVLSAWQSDHRQRLLRAGSFVVIACAVPWLVGLGPLGAGFVSRAGPVESRRLANARGADTAFIDAPPTNANRSSPSPPATPVAPGSSSPPPQPDPRPPPTENPPLAATRGVWVMLLEPTPWRKGSTSLQFARAETAVWYPVLGLAAYGLYAALKHRLRLAFPLFYGGGILLLYALVEGNIGTAYRHRGEFVWVVALLAAIGLQKWRSRRRNEGHEEVVTSS